MVFLLLALLAHAAMWALIWAAWRARRPKRRNDKVATLAADRPSLAPVPDEARPSASADPGAAIHRSLAALVPLLGLAACDLKFSEGPGVQVSVSTVVAQEQTIECQASSQGDCVVLLYEQVCDAAAAAASQPARQVCAYTEVETFHLPQGQSRKLQGKAGLLKACIGGTASPTLADCVARAKP